MELVTQRSEEAIARDAREYLSSVLMAHLPPFSAHESAVFGAEIDGEGKLTATIHFSLFGEERQRELRLNPDIWTELQVPETNMALRAIARMVETQPEPTAFTVPERIAA